MKYFKKYPLFFVVTGALLAAFAAFVVYDICLSNIRSDAGRRLSKEMNSYRVALGDDPTAVAISASDKNIKELEKYLLELEKSLTSAADDIFKPLPAKEGYQLVEYLRGFVNTWRKDARKADIKIADDMDFGFKKYVAPNAEPPRDDAISEIWKQACVLNYINKKLFMCKSEKSPMYILSVQREILPEEGVKESKNKRVNRLRKLETNAGDNFKIENAITARKAGSLDTLAYKFVFAGHTDVLRRFLNQLKNFDAMLVVRSIGVKPADMSAISQLEPAKEESEGGTGNPMDAMFSNAQTAENAQSSENTATQSGENSEQQQSSRTPVVTDNISEFTVVIEYVEVVKDTPKKDAKSVAKKSE